MDLVVLSLIRPTARKVLVPPVGRLALVGVSTTARSVGVGVAAEMVIWAVSDRPKVASVAAIQYVPGVVPAVYLPAASTVPPVAVQPAATGTVELSLARPTARNVRVAPVARLTELGEMVRLVAVPGTDESTVTVDVSARRLLRPLPLATTEKVPGAAEEKTPSVVMVPPDALQVTETGMLSPVEVRAIALNASVCLAWTRADAGPTTSAHDVGQTLLVERSEDWELRLATGVLVGKDEGDASIGSELHPLTMPRSMSSVAACRLRNARARLDTEAMIPLSI